MADETDHSQALAQSLARTAQGYDALPYLTKPTTLSHPARIGAIARLFGLEPVPCEAARILELGCGTGGNLIPVAAFHAGARLVGIDISPVQIAIGRQRIERLGLKNIELIAASLTDLGPELGEFDYIVCHGVYSWVPDTVRESILALCGSHLSEHGVAYVSYNVLPGWRMFQPLRDALRTIVPPHLDQQARARMARQFIAYAAQMTPKQGAYGDLLRDAPTRLADVSDDYLFHEFLEDDNAPCTFADFARAASRHGLGYLGDCQLSTMFARNFGQAFADKFDRSSAGDIVSTEQMLDILTGRTFRKTLLVRDSQFSRIDRAISPERLLALHALRTEGFVFRSESDHCTVSDGEHGAIAFENPLDVAFLTKLHAGPPRTVAIADHLQTLPEAHRSEALGRIFRLVLTGVATLSTEPMMAADLSMRPLANPLARLDALHGEALTASRRHVGVALNSSVRRVLPMLDGAHSSAEIEAILLDAAKAGQFEIRGQDGAMPGPAELPPAIGAMLREVLEQVAAYGLLDS